MESWKPVSVKDISRDFRLTHTPASILAFPFTENGLLLWVKHPLRGWEVPGGKVDTGETPLEALFREVYEETGALIDNPLWVAEYKIQVGDLSSPLLGESYKWVYFVRVTEIRERPAETEIVDVRTGPALLPHTLREDDSYSPIMKDAVYETLWPLIEAGYSI